MAADNDETARPRQPLATEPLASRKPRIAALVAQGLTKRKVAGALFLSPKTVEHHLSSVYRERGWRSRSELVRDLAGTDSHTVAPTAIPTEAPSAP